jgi:hypothetical protein
MRGKIMTKTCPNCGNQLDTKEKTCPNCGHTFENKEQATEETNTTFTNTEPNENIEWSELKDMSIGHVMTMFNEQQDAAEEPTTETSEEKDEASSSPLDQYINEHKTNNESDLKASETEPEIVSAELKAEAIAEATQEAAASVDADEPTEPKAVVPEEELTKQDSEQAISKLGEREAIRRFAKPETGEEASETPIVGPKAPPQKHPEILSKSKRPEEIEMDEAPIFFKEKDEAPNLQPAIEPKETKPVTDQQPKEKTPATKNYKKLSIILAAVVVLAGGSWAVYNQLQKEPGTQAVDKQEDVQKLQKELNSYFTDKAQTFIKPEMVDVAPKSIKTAIASIKNEDERKKLEDTYNKVVEKQAAISKTNELFTQPIINGDKLNTSVLKADQKVTVAKREEKDDFDKLLNQGRAEALAQYDQLQKAKAAVAGFYQNNEFTAALTRETYNAAKTEVDLVKNEALRKPLNEILAKADKVLSDAEAAAAEADQSVQTPTQTDPTYQADQTQQQTTGQQVDANGFSAPNADGVYTAPVYPENPADVADMSNPAWTWAPGVQEKVIATCIQRGYITAGAYSLQPARIVNGEGYYNLYGADNQYLVTINAKTGWFKGNASRNAGR